VRLLLFIGIPATGKSTFWREQLADTHLRVSRDMLKTPRREKILFDACLAVKCPFVLDNNNLTQLVRAPYITAARAAGYEVHAYYFDSTLADAIRRNANRRHSVPTVVVATAFRKLQPPVFSEGFSEIIRVQISKSPRFSLTTLPPETE
jgi:predicted kinase